MTKHSERYMALDIAMKILDEATEEIDFNKVETVQALNDAAILALIEIRKTKEYCMYNSRKEQLND